MSFPIRGAVYYNIKEMGPQQLKSMVEDSIQGEEKLLPGLGVLFEVIWQNSTPQDQEHMIETLHDHMPREQAQPPVAPS
ncbi:small acid-soluble spore protein SspI [Kroppenstedtia eburnea]|uniref:small acid-soluble spore protein SspI n=1 Tax=Kroppenstedtia eburnea TaxID=714067 RepID=UPI0036372650